MNDAVDAPADPVRHLDWSRSNLRHDFEALGLLLGILVVLLILTVTVGVAPPV